MTASAGATPDRLDWHTIDWEACQKEVRRLQVRIVKAAEKGKHGRVKALQRLLTRSFSAKCLAVRRVTENRGKRTAGVDSMTWDTPGTKASAIGSLKHRGYKPKPLKRVYIPKKNDKVRPLGIPTMKDRAMQALHLLALEPLSETFADPNSYGFRRGRSTQDAIEQCFASLAKKRSATWILEGDIKSCFDKIQHEWLVNNIPLENGIVTKWLKTGYMDKNTLFPTYEGTPQGGIISPTLANMALDGLEKVIHSHFRSNTKKIMKYKVNFIRYADDFVVTANDQETLNRLVIPVIETFLRERGLQLSPEKTKVTSIYNGFDFLGFNLRKYNSKLLIKPSKDSIKKVCCKLREILKTHKQATPSTIIRLLNPIIRGWANYYRHVVSGKAFKFVSAQIFKVIWRWCNRRHPNKGAKWIKKEIL